jgi:hypothetical protein
MPAMPGIANLLTGAEVIQDPQYVDDAVISRAVMYKCRLLAMKVHISHQIALLLQEHESK